MTDYLQETRALEATLLGLTDGGRLGEIFSRHTANPKPDACFDPEGQNPLKAFLLAASLNSAPVTQVYTWLTRPHDEAPAELQRTAEYDLLSDMVMGHIREPETQRAGVYGTAWQMVSCLTDREVSHWVTPARDTTVDTDPRPQFVPEDFVRGKGTLYSLSRESVGTAGPLVTALTVAVVEAAEKYATSNPAAGSRHHCSGSSMRPRTSAGGRPCLTSTATTAPAATANTDPRPPGRRARTRSCL